jgi:hypothetical protein
MIGRSPHRVDVAVTLRKYDSATIDVGHTGPRCPFPDRPGLRATRQPTKIIVELDMAATAPNTQPAGIVAVSRAVVSAAAEFVAGVERAMVGDANVRTAQGNAWDAVQADRARAQARDEMNQLVASLLTDSPRAERAPGIEGDPRTDGDRRASSGSYAKSGGGASGGSRASDGSRPNGGGRNSVGSRPSGSSRASDGGRNSGGRGSRSRKASLTSASSGTPR